MSGGHDRQPSEVPQAPSHVGVGERRGAEAQLPTREAALLALQRTAGNAAVAAMLSRRTNDRQVRARTLQRAVIGIHGPTNTPEERAVTEACFAVLTTTKTFKAGGKPLWTDVRGASIIVEAETAPSGWVWVSRPPPRNLLSSATETIYILGHGVPDSSLVADMTPAQMAVLLRRWFPRLRGRIKLVACYSAVDFNREQGVAPYASRLAALLGPQGADDEFRPPSVDGIIGIGWIDEETGELMSIDDDAWNDVAARIEEANHWTKGQGKGDAVIQKAFMEKNPRARKKKIQALFGSSPGVMGMAGPDDRPGAKRRYEVGTGELMTKA